MSRVKLVDAELSIEIDVEFGTKGDVLALAAGAMDCRRNTGNWEPDPTIVAVASEPVYCTDMTTSN